MSDSTRAGGHAGHGADGVDPDATARIDPVADDAPPPPAEDPDATARFAPVADDAPPAPSETRPVDTQPVNAQPVDTRPEDAQPRRGRTGWIVAGSTLAVLALGYGALAWWSGGRVPDGTTVAGIDVGGQGAEEAEATLNSRLPDVLAAPVPATIGGQEAQIAPQDAGLSVDVPATIDRLTGFTLNPAVVVERLTGGAEFRPVTAVDENRAQGTMRFLAEQYDSEPVEGAIAFGEGEPKVTPASDGISLQVDDAAQEFTAAWPSAEPIELPVETAEPAVGQEDVDAAMSGLVEPLLSAPVAVTAADHIAELTTDDLTAIATIAPDEAAGDGTLALTIDGEKARERVVEKAPELGSEAKDATFAFEGGVPVVVPASAGLGLDPAALGSAVHDAALSRDDRTARLELTQVEPELTTEEAQALGVVEPISEFATNLTNDSVRTQNLVLGSQRINGALVLPGENFSLLEHLGPITTANGFRASGVIANGFTDEAVGGGLSQLSTNTYNAGYLAGMVDVEHKPHSRYYTRYPAGREATLWDGQIDMVWKNDTPYGVVVEAWVEGGQQHVRLWSTKYWDVRTWDSGRYGIVAPTTKVNRASDCVPEGPGPAGFSITNYRERWRDGAKVDEQSSTWSYNPWYRVVCE